MTTRYDEPNLAARAGNELIRWLAEAGISIAGTRALRVRGRKTGKRRGVVINLLSREVRISEIGDDAKPQLLKRYLDRWYWEVKGHVGGLTPQSSVDEMRAAAPAIPVFELLR